MFKMQCDRGADEDGLVLEQGESILGTGGEKKNRTNPPHISEKI